MNIIKKIVKNSTIAIAGNIANSLVGMFVAIYLIRYLGATRYGEYSIVYAYLFFFQTISQFGIDSIVIREICRDSLRAEKLISNCITLKIVLTGVAIFAACIVLQTIGYPPQVKTLIYIGSFSMLSSLGTLYAAYFRAHLKIEYPMLIQFVFQIVRAVLMLLLIYWKSDLINFIILDLLIQLLQVPVLWRLSKKFVISGLSMDLNIWKEILYASWPIALVGFFSTIYTRIDQVMLFQMIGGKAVGLYAVTVKLTEFLSIIPPMFMVSVFPVISQYAVNSSKKFEKARQLSFKYLSTLIVPIAFGTTILANQIMKLLFGEQFLPATSALKILIWSEIFIFLDTANLTILISAGLQKWNALFSFSIALINILLNLLLIPVWGITGAAVATTVSYGSFIFSAYFFNPTRPFAKQIVISLIKPVIASCIMAVIIWNIPRINLLVTIIIGMVIYFPSLILLKGLTYEDLRYFKRLIEVRANSV
jgi:O-antigen/teichoic acid export membrane protein